jgi:hypothetical protein
VGYQKVPCPVNLESVSTLCQLLDCNNNDPWDTNTVTQLYPSKNNHYNSDADSMNSSLSEQDIQQAYKDAERTSSLLTST